MGKWWSLLFAVTMALCGGLFVAAPFWGMWLPEGVSSHAYDIDFLFYVILAITGFFFVLTEAILCVFMFKYGSDREKPTAPATPGFAARLFQPVTNILNDAHKVEMAWTIVPAVILLYIAFAQVNTWANVKYQSQLKLLQEKQTPLQLAVSARQFEWRVRYPSSERLAQWLSKNKDEADFKSFAVTEHRDDIHLVNEVHVVKDHLALVHLSTLDVIHSFNLPHHRVKQDALPGKKIPVWFTPTKENTIYDAKLGAHVDGYNPGDPNKPETAKLNDEKYIWDIPCAELCGWGHFRMVGRIYVHKDREDFLKWLRKAESQFNAQKPDKITAQ